MKKLRLHCLILISSLWLSACGRQEKLDPNYAQLANYLEKAQDYKLTANIRTVFILTEQGCMGCNKTFSNFIAQHLGRQDCLFLILARGARIDVSMFGKAQANILQDALQNIEAPLFQKTKALSIKDKKVVKSIEIDINQIEDKLKEIAKWVD